MPASTGPDGTDNWENARTLVHLPLSPSPSFSPSPLFFPCHVMSVVNIVAEFTHTHSLLLLLVS